MSTYVISDIHGQYKSFKKMLKLISFGKDDTLYLLGDVIDRGDEGIKVLTEAMKMPNVHLFLGNHELLMLDALKNIEENKRGDRKDFDDMDLWLDPYNGGESTFEAYKTLQPKQKKEILTYLENSIVVKKIKIGRKKYHLSHAYVLPYDFEDELRYKDVPYKEKWDVVWQSIFELSPNESPTEIFPNKKFTYILGHTFTQRLDCMDSDGRGVVYYNKNFKGYRIYNIDCGMALHNKSSQLACIRLEDEKIFYVPLYKDIKNL